MTEVTQDVAVNQDKKDFVKLENSNGYQRQETQVNGIKEEIKPKKQESQPSSSEHSSQEKKPDRTPDVKMEDAFNSEENTTRKESLLSSKNQKDDKKPRIGNKDRDKVSKSDKKEKISKNDKKHKIHEKESEEKKDKKVKHSKDKHSKEDKRHKEDKKYKEDKRRSRSRDKRDKSRERKSSHRSKPKRSPSRHHRTSKHKSKYSRSRSPSYSRRRYKSPSRDRYRSRSRDRHRSRASPRRRRSPGSPPLGYRGSRSRSIDSDRYGGYQPRKRQEPIKTGPYTSVVAQIKPPPPLNTVQKGKSFQIIQPLHSRKEVMTAEEQKLHQEKQMLQARQMILQQQAASAAAAACKTQREFSSQIYVGNLIGGMVSEPALRELLNSCLTAAFPKFNMGTHMLPVVTINMHGDGRYAFVELRSSEMTAAAIQLSGQLQFMGQTLSIGRPSGYIDPEKAKKSAIDAAKALAQFNATDPTKVQEIKFDQKIMDAMSSQLLEKAEAITKYLCIVGIVNSKVFIEESEYREILEEIKDECSKYGKVREVIIPKPGIIVCLNPEQQAEVLMGTKDYGKVFIKYETPQEAEAARTAINGRLFDGVTLQVTFVTKDKYYMVEL